MSRLARFFCCAAIALLAVSPALASTGSAQDVDAEAAGYCSATTYCWDGSKVSCLGVVNCSSHDSNCAVGFRGYAECDDARIMCPPCPSPPVCSREGDFCLDDRECRPRDEPACDLCLCRFEDTKAISGSCVCP